MNVNFVLSPTGFLKIGGIVLLVLGLVGYTGVTNSVEAFQLDNGENIAHTVLGVAGIAIGFGLKNEQLHRWVVGALLALGIVATLWSLFNTSGAFVSGTGFTNPNAGFTNLENPADTVLHLVVSAWAAVAVFWRGAAAAMPAASRG